MTFYTNLSWVQNHCVFASKKWMDLLTYFIQNFRGEKPLRICCEKMDGFINIFYTKLSWVQNHCVFASKKWMDLLTFMMKLAI